MFGCQYPAKLGNSTAVCRGRNEVDDKKKIEKIKEKEREKVIYLTHGSDRKSCSTKKFSLFVFINRLVSVLHKVNFLLCTAAVSFNHFAGQSMNGHNL